MVGARRFITLTAVCCFCLPWPLIGQNLEMGDTYRSLDAQVVSVTSDFRDASVTTERDVDGSLITRLYATDGYFGGSLSVAPDGSMVIRSPDLVGPGVEVGHPAFEPSTDWANLQLLSLWRDLRAVRLHTGVPTDAAQLRWEGTLLRPWQASALSAETPAATLENEALAVTARFRTHSGVDLVATSVQEKRPFNRGKRGDRTAHATFTTELMDPASGAKLGIMRWFEDVQVLAWSFSGVTEGWVDSQRQEQPFAFEPDLVWGNVQAFAFWQAHSSRALAKELLILKNTVGCDGLHWLDNTIYRPCCDQHDLCYEKNGCTASSWWVFGSSWSCIKCNINVVFCFITTTLGGGGGGGTGGGGGGGGSCTVSGAEWCPAECFSCTRQAY